MSLNGDIKSSLGEWEEEKLSEKSDVSEKSENKVIQLDKHVNFNSR